jgi:translation elongation factor EF-4
LQLPLSELAGQFYSSLKSCTSGYATFDYEPGPYRSADLVRLDFLVHGAPVDALTRVVHRNDAVSIARSVCQKLKEVISRQAFEV